MDKDDGSHMLCSRSNDDGLGRCRPCSFGSHRLDSVALRPRPLRNAYYMPLGINQEADITHVRSTHRHPLCIAYGCRSQRERADADQIGRASRSACVTIVSVGARR